MTGVIVAADPGFSGAIAFLSGPNDLQVFDMPTLEMKRNGKARRVLNYHEIARLFDLAVDADTFWVESVSSMPGQGVSSSFAFGKSTGALIGAAAANYWRIEEVSPQVWRRGVGLKTGQGKDASRALATHLFPKHSALFARAKDEGRAESALIAWYAFNKACEDRTLE